MVCESAFSSALTKYHYSFQEVDPEDDEDLDLPLAQRRKRRQINLPTRYDDDLPEALQALPPPEALAIPSGMYSKHLEFHLHAHTSNLGGLNIVESPPNCFGLFRRYFADTFPAHDPDSDITLVDLCDIPSRIPEVTGDVSPTDISGVEDYSPYPNRSSFLLGEWNWNDQVQKSKSTFNTLVDIIKDPDFHPCDIQDTQWESIDKQLGSSDDTWIDDDDLVPSWIRNDARWSRTQITISVPFHRYTSNPGPRDYDIPDFYHRSIVSILREALSHPLESLHFHHEPYELYWKCREGVEPMRVFGELYTSPSFIDAHRALQDSPPEPGCTLPRIVASLMLASDATHVTSFGETKIWPQYLYFGNHSKYRRCKPSCHLCYHVAYFQRVGGIFPYF